MTTEYEKNAVWQNGGLSKPWFQQFTPQTGHKLTQLTLMLHGSYSPYTITVEETTNGIPNGTVKATFTFSGTWSGWAARTATCSAIKLNQGQVYAIYSAGTGAHGLNNADTYAYGVYKYFNYGVWNSYAGDAYFIEAGDPLPVAPTVTTQEPTDIDKSSCTGNGNITSTGGENCTRRGFCYKAGTSGDPTVEDSVVYDDGDFSTGAYTKSITGLTPDTSYRVRAYAVNSEGTSYGDTYQIKTLVAATYVEILTADRALALDNTTDFTPTADYHPATKKYVDDHAGGGSGDMLKSVYDTDDDGKVDAAESADAAGNADTLDGDHAADIVSDAVAAAKADADISDAIDKKHSANGDTDLDSTFEATFVKKADYDEQTILAAAADNTPSALTIGEQTVVGRITGGSIAALTVSQLITLALSGILPENVTVRLADSLSADGKYSGKTESGTLGETVAYGEVVYFKTSDSKWYLAKADAAATSSGKLAICLVGGNANAATTLLLWGKIRADAKFPTFTVGTPIYLSAATGGQMTSTAPSGTTNYVIRIVAYGNTGDEIYFYPDPTYLELA